MPLILGNSLHKIPGAKMDDYERGLGMARAAQQVREPRTSRPTRYPLGIPIGCGVLIGLCMLLLASTGLVRTPWRPSAPTSDYAGLATSAFGTALATQLSMLPADTVASPVATPSADIATAAAPTAAPSSNPWASEIPKAACIPADLPQTGRVVEVIDGRTVKVLLDGDGRVFSVRYIGVASPDTSRGPSLPAAALARNAQLAYHKQATLVRDITDADPNGTLLRYVMVEHVFVNYAILAGGYVRAASSPPDTACLTALTEAENLAKSSGLGVWAAPFNDTPPPATP